MDGDELRSKVPHGSYCCQPVGRPHPALLSLAAGRGPGDIDHAGRALYDSAMEHGMQGLLWSWLRDHDGGWAHAADVAAADLATRHRHRTLWDTLATTRARLEAHGIDAVAIKGVTAEARWYDRAGERPCTDVDVLVAPDAIAHADDVLDALQPDHPLRGHLSDLVRAGVMQSVNTVVDGVAVDVHFDLFKLGMPSTAHDEIWERTERHPLPDGTKVRVLDADISLVHFLLHLNKDSFAMLLGFVDVARILRSDAVDWSFVARFVRDEGLDVPVSRALATVTDVLALAPSPLPRASGARAVVWDVTWPRRAMLLGSSGTHRSRRQDVLPYLVRGRASDAVRWTWRTILPPTVAVARQYPDVHGPYVVRLARGRWRTARERRRALRARAAAPAGDGAPPEGAVRDPAARAALVRKELAAGRTSLVVRGTSMGWSVPDGATVVLALRTGVDPRRGEVWAFCDDDGRILVHRARGRAGDRHRFQGDAVVRADDPVPSTQLIGRVERVTPRRPRVVWGPVAGAVQRAPRAVVARAARRLRRRRSPA